MTSYFLWFLVPLAPMLILFVMLLMRKPDADPPEPKPDESDAPD